MSVKLSAVALLDLSPEDLADLEIPTFYTSAPWKLTDADLAVSLVAAYGLVPDPWQEYVLSDWLAYLPGGRWANITCALSLPRQNGKNALVEMREIYGAVGRGENILHTAHEVKTAIKAFKRLQYFFGESENDPEARFPELNALVKSVRNTNGQEAIFLKNGGSIEISARSKSSGRGFTVDLVIFDEAQHCSDDDLEALLATTTAAPHGNPQWIFIGTPPGPKANGEVFTRIRLEAKTGSDSRLSWIEYGADPGDDLDDRTMWRRVNPALGHRLQWDVVEAERRRYSDEGFLRERCGGWSAAVSNRVITEEAWELARDAESFAVDCFALAVDVAPDMTSAAVAIAGIRPDGTYHVDIGAHQQGADWVAAWVNRFLLLNPEVRAVVIDVGGPAATIMEDIKAAKLRITTPTVRDVGAGCARFVKEVRTGGLFHLGDVRLTTAVDNGRRRSLGATGLWAWNRKTPDSDITPLVSATLALWGAMKTSPKKPVVTRGGTTRRGRTRAVTSTRRGAVL